MARSFSVCCLSSAVRADPSAGLRASTVRLLCCRCRLVSFTAPRPRLAHSPAAASRRRFALLDSCCPASSVVLLLPSASLASSGNQRQQSHNNQSNNSSGATTATRSNSKQRNERNEAQEAGERPTAQKGTPSRKLLGHFLRKDVRTPQKLQQVQQVSRAEGY